MKLDNRTEIRYEATLGTTAAFILVLEGEITMRVYCDMADDTRIIKVATPDGTHVLDTNGRFELTEKLTEAPDGTPLGVETRVFNVGVYKYVMPRVHILLGRLLRAAAA